MIQREMEIGSSIFYKNKKNAACDSCLSVSACTPYTNDCEKRNNELNISRKNLTRIFTAHSYEEDAFI